jgi:PIN domain nuclease of toxin-antitoxin system
MSNPVTVYVLDTSAWLTLIEDELGADIVQRLLEDTQAGQAVVLTSFMS